MRFFYMVMRNVSYGMNCLFYGDVSAMISQTRS